MDVISEYGSHKTPDDIMYMALGKAGKLTFCFYCTYLYKNPFSRCHSLSLTVW